MNDFLMNLDVRIIELGTQAGLLFSMIAAIIIICVLIILNSFFKKEISEGLINLMSLLGVVVSIFGISLGNLNSNFLKKTEISLNKDYYFSSDCYVMAENVKTCTSKFIVYKKYFVEKTLNNIVYEKAGNGLEIEKTKEEINIETSKEVLFKTSCSGYSVNQCVEKVKELLKDGTYAFKLNNNLEVRL